MTGQRLMMRSLLATLETWLLPHMSGVHSLRGLKSLDIYQALRGLLDWGMQQRLDGSACALRCADGKPDRHSLS